MKRQLLVLTGLLLMMAGCSNKKVVFEYSAIIEEPVKVRNLVYVPAVHGSAVGPTVGMDFDGNLNMGVAITSVGTEEEFAIVFECQHGGFIIKRENLWKRLHEDSLYTCQYVEVWQVTYEDSVALEKKFIDYDFLGLKEFPDLIEPIEKRSRW